MTGNAALLNIPITGRGTDSLLVNRQSHINRRQGQHVHAHAPATRFDFSMFNAMCRGLIHAAEHIHEAYVSQIVKVVPWQLVAEFQEDSHARPLEQNKELCGTLEK